MQSSSMHEFHGDVLSVFTCCCSLFLFWHIWSKKIKIVSLSWNLALDFFEYAELCKEYVVFTFSVLDQKTPFWANLVFKIKIVSLSGNLVPRPIWICIIQWWCSLFSVFDRKYLFGEIWSKKPKLFVRSEIWYKH